MFASIAVAAALAMEVTVSYSDKIALDSLHAAERSLIESTNRERARHRLRPLKLDMRLMKSARRHALWMTRRRALQHTSQSVGENIAMGQTNTREAVRAWMNSSGHRANMLHAGYTRVGAAGYTTPSGTTYWCIQFLR